MSGSRTVTGCWTCRIRRKKCDEDKPYCSACTTRAIPCLGYSSQRPEWMQQAGRSWQEILSSEPAQVLRRMAQQSYQESRIIDHVNPGNRTLWHGEMSWELDRHPSTTQAYEFNPISFDSSTQVTLPFDSPEAQSLLNYLEPVFQLQFGWCSLPNMTSSQHRKLWHQVLQANEPLCDTFVALRLSLEDRPAGDGGTRGSVPEVDRARYLYGEALRKLQSMIDDISLPPEQCSPEANVKKVRVLAAAIALVTFEAFTHFGGAWKTHFDAAEKILGMLQSQMTSDYQTVTDRAVESTRQPLDSEQSLMLRIYANLLACFDLIAQSTLGPSLEPGNLPIDYMALLQEESPDAGGTRGVSKRVWLAISQVVNLERTRGNPGHDPSSIQATALGIEHDLRAFIEQKGRANEKDESNLVSAIFALGGLVYLHTVTSASPSDDHSMTAAVTGCLEELEKLPAGLLSRVIWPFTLAGCMTHRRDEQARFRALATGHIIAGHFVSSIWKGRFIMETCWRLQEQGGGKVTWRSALDLLGEGILLI